MEKLHQNFSTNTNFNSIQDKYIDCSNDITKPLNFYFNKENNDYEPCFYTCATCKYGGDGNENNCTSCETNLIFKLDYINSKNCVKKCNYYYFYNLLEQYQCTTKNKCPEDFSFFLKDKNKCIDN